MKKIVLVNPPLTLEERYGTLAKGGTSLPPLGLTTLAAVIKRNSIPVGIVDAAVLNLSYNDTVRDILKEEPNFVGITASTVSVHNAAKVARMIKETSSNMITLLGGPHLTAIPEQTMGMFPEFDIGVIGEGERTIITLLEALESREQLNKVPGIVYREGETIVNTGRVEFIQDLDTLPMDAWDLLPNFPFSYKSSVHKLGRWPTTSLITSRGCPFKCRFCDNSVFGRKVRGYSAGYLVDMIKYLQKKYGVKDVFINDDNFVMLRRRLVEFCDLIKKEKLDLTWGCYSRVDSVTEEILKIMKSAGCWRISYGLESGSQEILNFYRKNETLEQMERAIKWTKEAGIRSKGFFMMGNLLETEQTLRKTIDFAKRLPLDDFHATFLTPLPGSEIHSIADSYGTFDRDWKKMSMWFPVFVPHDLSQKILEKYRKKAFLEFYLRPRIIISYLKSIESLTDVKKLLLGVYTLIDSVFSKIKLK